MPRTCEKCFAVLLLWIGLNIHSGLVEGAEPLLFTDVTDSSGIDFSITQEPPLTGTGIVVIDVDDDGLYDLIFSGGVGQPLVLYHNEGNLVFSEVSSEVSGLTDYGGDPRGLAAADYDNDGDTDLFVSNWADNGSSHLLRQDGGKFVEVTEMAGILVNGSASGGAWGDYDNDGWLDLYVTRYWSGQNLLFRNQHDGSFVDVTEAVGLDKSILQVGAQSFQAIWFDVDRDGDLDLYEMNDRCYNGYAPNFLWENQGDGTFLENAAFWGMDHCFDAMGLGLADMNRDGFPDLFMTNVPDGHFLLRGGCNGYQDVTGPSGTASYQWGWGVVFADLNHDTWPDLYVAHAGYVSFDRPNRLLMNEGDETFLDVSSLSDASGGEVDSSAVVRGDFDLDGDQDLVVANLFELPFLVLRNEGPTENYLRIGLEGVDSNRDGIGTWVEVLAGGIWQRACRYESSAFSGSHAPDLLFGLGGATSVQRVVVYWPSGAVQVLEELDVNQEVLIVEEPNAGGIPPLWSERCGDGVDNDCDGQVDEGFSEGEPCVVGVGACAVDGLTTCSIDAESLVCQGTPLLPNEELGGDGIDNDCDGQTDEVPSSGEVVCAGTVELCGDGLDNDCDDEVDEGFPVGTMCTVGVGACEVQGTQSCTDDLLSMKCEGEPSLPEEEVCGDVIDNDCDGETDEGYAVGGGCIGELAGCTFLGQLACGPAGYSVVCVPDSLADNPKEICGDGIDNDCDGMTDEGFPVGGVCWAGEGVCRRKGIMTCSADGLALECDAIPGEPGIEQELDGFDNDCDGTIDEVEENGIVPTTGEDIALSRSPPPQEQASGCETTGSSKGALFWTLIMLLWFVACVRRKDGRSSILSSGTGCSGHGVLPWDA